MRLGCRCIVLFLAVTIPATGQQFSSAMRDIFGRDFPHYQWLDYPLNDFGVGTAYRDTKETANDRNFLCATFDCLNIEPAPASNTDEGLNKQWLLVAPSPNADRGYADYGCGGPVQDALSKHSGTAIRAFLSKMLTLAGVSLNLEESGETSIELVLNSACKRLLNGRIQHFIEGLKSDQYGIRKAAVDRKLILIKGDIVIDKMEIKIHNASQNLKAQFDAKLGGALAKKFGSDSKFTIELSRDQTGDYYLSTTSPVIVGVLAGRQPVFMTENYEADELSSKKIGDEGGVGSYKKGQTSEAPHKEGGKKAGKIWQPRWDVQEWESTTIPLPR